MKDVDRLVIDDVILKKNKIEIKYRPLGKTLEAITNSLEWYVEYNTDISGVPRSVAVIPFITNVLPFIWLQDAIIECDELDEDFYNSIIWFKKGYIDMYPELRFRGGTGIDVKHLISNKYEPSSKTIMLYSGGVDSTSTLATHINEDMHLLTLWGADVYFNDEEGWGRVKKNSETVARKFGLRSFFAKSCFKRNLKYVYLNNLVKPARDNYWHGFQHGIGLIGHFAPLAFKYKYKQCYIPASPSVKDETYESCASCPSIDEKVNFCGCKVIHDGYEWNRQDRLKNIFECAKKHDFDFTIRVCFMSKGGGNCCHCEKCVRTIIAILVLGKDPRKFGFPYDEKELLKSIEGVKSSNLPPMLVHFWEGIRKEYIKNKQTLSEFDFLLNWLEIHDFSKRH